MPGASGNTANGTYRLFDAGNFELRYGAFPPYTGVYTRSDTVITLVFWSSVPSWCNQAWCQKAAARALLANDTLTIKYDEASAWLLCNDIMDFDACETAPTLRYVRVP